MKSLKRRATAVGAAMAIALGSSVALAPSANALVNPETVKCTNIFTKAACNKAKAWYSEYWQYGITEVQFSLAGTTAARDGLRVMAAMAVGNALGGDGSRLLDNIDGELNLLWRTTKGMSCAKAALYDTANTIRERREAINGMETTFKLMKKAAGKNKTLKAYAQIGSASMKTADQLNQRARAGELYQRLMSC